MLYLKKANPEDIEAEWRFVAAQPANENGLTNPWTGVTREDFEKTALPQMMANAEGRELPSGYVPCTTLFLWEDDRLVGEYRVRHFLNESLRTGAGHIGYGIAASERGRGLATAGLKLALDYARKVVPDEEFYLRVMKSNPASLRVMQKNGGRVVAEDEGHFFVHIAK